MSSILIRNATIVNENRVFNGDVLIAGEIIGSVAENGMKAIPTDCEIIDADGLLLIPGIIDDQVHFREPGLTHKGDIRSESRAAAAGGITSFMDMPNTIPQTTTIGLLQEKARIAAEKSLINFSFYLGATNDNLDEILRIDPALVCGIKVFMGSSTGNMLVDSEQALRNIFGKANVPVACHCESESTIRKNMVSARNKYGENIPASMHPLIRSREACLLSSSNAAELALEYGTRLHILHLSTKEELSLFRNDLPLNEKKITAEVCVHHLWFDDTYYDSLGNKIKWNPAIKTRVDRESLIDGVNNDLIDIIATDHAPHTAEEKQESYLKAPSGGPLVQHSLVAMLELWHRGVFTIEKIVEKMCHNPAVLFRIRDRGFVREGYKADLVLIDTEKPWSVSKENILYKCGWSPFEGSRFRSKVIKTIVNGSVVYDNGVFNEESRGQGLQFERQ
ncbi:MAG TPA: dihydroorotase [Bacteroidales bacterium]|jgi:dihydroorotase|nr:dihydroorotase [Bacteroidales bacterium]HNR41899.1 dihydroorotase [Bacteroidales bacterium]HQG77082.1 dihydroorotase [Bacteroidales bacterium]